LRATTVALDLIALRPGHSSDPLLRRVAMNRTGALDSEPVTDAERQADSVS
jgi:hypothetical protein